MFNGFEKPTDLPIDSMGRPEMDERNLQTGPQARLFAIDRRTAEQGAGGVR